MGCCWMVVARLFRVNYLFFCLLRVTEGGGGQKSILSGRGGEGKRKEEVSSSSSSSCEARGGHIRARQDGKGRRGPLPPSERKTDLCPPSHSRKKGLERLMGHRQKRVKGKHLIVLSKQSGKYAFDVFSQCGYVSLFSQF